MAKKYRPQKSSETVEKQVVLGLAEKYRHQFPTRWSWIPQKPLGKQAKRAEGLRHGIYPPAALLNRDKTVLRGNPYKTNGKLAFNLGTMYAAMSNMMPRLRKTRWNEKPYKTNEKHGSTRRQWQSLYCSNLYNWALQEVKQSKSTCGKKIRNPGFTPDGSTKLTAGHLI